MTQATAEWISKVTFSIMFVCVGWSFGADYVQQKWKKETTAQAATQTQAVLAAVKNNTAIEKLQADKNVKVLIKNEQANTEVKATGAAIRKSVATAGGLRIPAASCNGPAATGQAANASEANGAATGTRVLPQEIEGNLWELMEEADLIVERHRSTIEWGVEQGFVEDSNAAAEVLK